MLLLVVAALFYYYIETRTIKIDAVKLVEEYIVNESDAAKKYRNKDLELTGSIKAFYDLSEIGNVLELNDSNPEIFLYCFFQNKPDEEKAALLNQKDTVTFVGICAGKVKYKLGDVLRFDVKQIKN